MHLQPHLLVLEWVSLARLLLLEPHLFSELLNNNLEVSSNPQLLQLKVLVLLHFSNSHPNNQQHPPYSDKDKPPEDFSNPKPREQPHLHHYLVELLQEDPYSLDKLLLVYLSNNLYFRTQVDYSTRAHL
jgi:hypothetical protein